MDNSLNNAPSQEIQLTETQKKQYSEYLTFRSFYTGFPVSNTDLTKIEDADQGLSFIRKRSEATQDKCLLLSSGMDSAIFAAFMPPGSTAYTIYHKSLERTEIDLAKEYCDKFKLNHVLISIDPEEYLAVVDELMVRKSMPLSSAEPVFYIASKRAVQDGHKVIVTGSGADGKHGGYGHLRKNLPPKQFEENLQKYYVRARDVLVQGIGIEHVLENYVLAEEDVIDSDRFLREVGAERFAHDNAIHSAGGIHFCPLTEMQFDFDADFNRKHQKYFIRQMYKKIYGHEPPQKFGMQKPSFVLNNYKPKNRGLFRDFSVSEYGYDAKFMIYCLERFHEKFG